MTRLCSIRPILAGVVALGAIAGAGTAHAVAIVSSFNTGGEAIAVAEDPVSGNLFVYNSAFGTIDEVTTTGAAVGSIARPGNSSNDFGLDFGPSGLIAFNGDDSPETAYFHTGTGAPVTPLALPSLSMVGGTFNAATGTLFTVDFGGLDLIREVDPVTGVEINAFGPGVGFGVFFGGIDAIDNGNLLLVSSTQNIVRELTAGGALVTDTDVSALFGPGLLTGGMSGISAIDASRMWITTTGGDVALIDLNGVATVSEPGSLAVLAFGLAALGLARRRRALR